MPLGNGGVSVLVWPEGTNGTVINGSAGGPDAGGIGCYIRSANAMDANTALRTIALLHVTLTPNPFLAGGGTYFNQTLSLRTATVIILAGGTSAADYAVRIEAYVGADADEVRVTATPREPSDVYTVDVTVETPGGGEIIDRLPTAAGLPSGSLLVYRENNASTVVSQALTSQGVPELKDVTTDWWSNLTSGVIVEGSCGASELQRTSSASLTQHRCAQLEVRARVLAKQSPSIGDWLRELAAVPRSTKAAHLSFWSDFWERSYIEITEPSPAEDVWISTDDELGGTEPVPGMVLWLKADALHGVADGSKVSKWPNSAPGATASSDAVQPQPELQPTFVARGNVSAEKPAVRFNSGGATSTSGTSLFGHSFGKDELPADSTMFAVFYDNHSPGTCCNSIFVSTGANGIATKPGSTDVGHGMQVFADYSGTEESGIYDVERRPVVVAAQYSATTTASWVDSCPNTFNRAAKGESSSGYQVGSRLLESHAGQPVSPIDAGRFFNGDIAEIIVYSSILSVEQREMVEKYLSTKWDLPPLLKCDPPPPPPVPESFQISQQYAITRFVQAAQTRASKTMWPIKFNGLTGYIANRGNACDQRDWGSMNWWQNTRLPYWTMFGPGDFEQLEVVFKYYLNMVQFANGRTQIYFNHTGIFFTETKQLFGAFGAGHGDTSKGWPIWLESNDYVTSPDIALQQ